MDIFTNIVGKKEIFWYGTICQLCIGVWADLEMNRDYYLGLKLGIYKINNNKRILVIIKISNQCINKILNYEYIIYTI